MPNGRNRPRMAGDGRKLTAAQERAITALLSERSIQAAADASGIAYRTLSRWLSSEPFATEYRTRLDLLVEGAAAEIRQALSGAVETLRTICEDASASPGYRISAARALLEAGLRYVELTDILRRLEALEAEA